jgi:nitroreductase
MNKGKDYSSDKVYKTMVKRRSIRRFQQVPIELELLKRFVNAARMAPSAANRQPLEYFIVTEDMLRKKIFTTLNWVGYIKPRWAPDEKERPTAYIVILVTNIENRSYLRDVGLASANIILSAEEENIGSCIICSIDRDKIREILILPEELHVDSVIALGYKAEHPVVEDWKGSVKYWRDQDDVLHVPKRELEDILHINKF